jgi:ABC-2 type transport system ATP-binding protein
MRQRLHIARGILTDPEVIFMDEPTIGLDPAGAQELRQLVPEMVKRGKTILLTTHYMSEADELSHQIAIINKGRVIATGTPSEIKRHFAKVAVLEVGLRSLREDAQERVSSIKGVIRVGSIADGPLQKLTIQVQPEADIKLEVKRVLGENSIDYISMRDPTLEEAYLSIIK